MFSSTKVLIIGKSHQISYLETKDPREPFPLWKMQGCLTLTLKQLKRSSALSLLRTHIFLKQVTSKETEIFWYNVKHSSVPINSNSPYPTQFLSLDVLQAEGIVYVQYSLCGKLRGTYPQILDSKHYWEEQCWAGGYLTQWETRWKWRLMENKLLFLNTTSP